MVLPRFTHASVNRCVCPTNKMICRTVFTLFLTVTSLSVNGTLGESSSTRTETFYQKQTGDYNVRLHLKDFQIIAILGGDALGSMNDNYEYDYEIPEEYLDVTSATTQKPSNTSSAPTTIRTTRKPTTQATTKTSATPSTTRRTTATTTTTTESTTEATTSKTESASETTPGNVTAEKSDKNVTARLETLAIDRIPVMVMQGNFEGDGVAGGTKNKKHDVAFANVAIVPEDDDGGGGGGLVERPVALGEILHYKRCAHGYTRDKRGRCRKIRRPQLPFDIARLASNWAARLKYPKAESTERPVQD